MSWRIVDSTAPIAYQNKVLARGGYIFMPLMGPQGPTGAQGPPGLSGPPGVTYNHVQSVISGSWVVNHNLGFRPTISVLTAGGLEVEPGIIHLSVNSVQLDFLTPMSGSAHFT